MAWASMIAAFTVECCSAQTVAGRALDDDGDPIAYAIISHARDPVTARAMTSESGAFESFGQISTNDLTRNGTRFTEIQEGSPIEETPFFEPVFANAINRGQLGRFAC